MLSNYHTHTLFCDGKNSPEEIVEEAIKQGLSEIGFTGHSYTFFDESYCMSLENTKKYKENINELKEKYKDYIKIFLGVEQDYFSEENTDDYDYVIGSVHYVFKYGKYLELDRSSDYFESIVKEYYNGSYYCLCEDYYQLVSNIYKKTKCDIVGHFDLVSKYNEEERLFSESDLRYKDMVKKAVNILSGENVLFEINTGAMARGLKSTPYPSPYIRKILKEKNCRFVASSDCHRKEFLTFGLKTYEENQVFSLIDKISVR